MCRLTVLTPTPLFDTGYRLTVFNTAMLAAALEDQTHGAGIWDGSTVTKVDANYRDMSPVYILDLKDDVSWLGHVRRRSPGTGSDVMAAHPYEFWPNGKEGGKLVVAHNGFITGTVGKKDDEANTDSYRAARVLSDMIAAGAAIDRATIEKWVATFGYGSEWSITLTYQGWTYIVRGQRTIFSTDLGRGNGVLYNTSDDVLVYVRSYLYCIDQGIKLNAIKLIPQHQLITIKPNGEVSQEAYHFQPPAAPKPDPFLWTSDPQGNIIQA